LERARVAAEAGSARFLRPNQLITIEIKQVIPCGNIALLHTQWKISSPHQLSVYAIEVARRQADGTWRWLIGDPFTVGRHAAHLSSTSAVV
jgi:ketosteroid isomerase-like protein